MSSMTETYKTPEGFELAKPLLFPDVRDFAEVLTAERLWDFATMSHKNGYPQAETPENIKREGWDKTVGRFCSMRNVPGGRHLQVTPTDRVLNKVYADEAESLDFAFFDHVGWEAIYHERNDRVLIVASASGIIASRYVAYVTLESAPFRMPLDNENA